MAPVLMLAAILLPVFGGVLAFVIPFGKRRNMEIWLEATVLITSAVVWAILAEPPEEALPVVKFVNNLSLSLKLDGCGMVFAGLISALWPLAMLYSFEYMKKEQHEKVFFLFFTMTYGITLGIAFAEDMLTMYFFYELLTLVTVPLVLHTLSREAILATRKYLYYSLGGAAFAFIGLVFLMIYGSTLNFTYGGVLTAEALEDHADTLLFVYVMAFMGFGVKAAVCPFNSWLPQAGVAPTPVTALLHAVAVVKAGAFAIIRLTYYSFGTEFLAGSWAQNAVMAVVIFTIVYGCSRAVKETHIKRRLAYSTISNLSYILFGVTIMTPLGLLGAFAHIIFHAVIKICSFFCAGAITYQTGKRYVHELDGLGRKMPVVFGAFTVSALALMGVPGFCGFISKWYLANAAVMSNNPMAYAGIGALLISALLTAIYMLTIVVRAFFVRPADETEENGNKAGSGNAEENGNRAESENAEDPNWLMLLPLCLFAGFMLFAGLASDGLMKVLTDISNGVM